MAAIEQCFGTKARSLQGRASATDAIGSAHAVAIVVRVAALFLASLVSSYSGFCQTNGLLTYQGRIVVSNFLYNGTGFFKFALVNSNSSQFYWTSAASSVASGEPDHAVPVPVSAGIYNVTLGDTSLSNMATLPVSVFAKAVGDLPYSPLFLRVWFDDGTNGSMVLSPDQRVTASGFSLASSFATLAAGVPNGAITASQLAPGVLSASNLTGSLNLSALPPQVALKTPDLSSLSNSIAGQLAALSAQLGALSNQVQTSLSVSNLLAALPEVTLVSPLAVDPFLAGLGFQTFYSTAMIPWSFGSTQNEPGPRFGHSAVWAGSMWFIWGGSIGTQSQFSGSGGLYNPALDAWSVLDPDPCLVAQKQRIRRLGRCRHRRVGRQLQRRPREYRGSLCSRQRVDDPASGLDCRPNWPFRGMDGSWHGGLGRKERGSWSAGRRGILQSDHSTVVGAANSPRPVSKIWRGRRLGYRQTFGLGRLRSGWRTCRWRGADLQFGDSGKSMENAGTPRGAVGESRTRCRLDGQSVYCLGRVDWRTAVKRWRRIFACLRFLGSHFEFRCSSAPHRACRDLDGDGNADFGWDNIDRRCSFRVGLRPYP